MSNPLRIPFATDHENRPPMARILLIDDDDLLRDTVHQMLAIDRHEVVEAVDGERGLAAYAGGRFDVVITDILMPRVDGAEVVNRIRERAPGQAVIAMSGGRRVLSASFNLQTAVLAGATTQLAKPFTLHQLRAAIQQAMESAATRA